eukprot:jgi/Picsp_1/6640/NSC_03983-R1_gpi mannosyltransferase 2
MWVSNAIFEDLSTSDHLQSYPCDSLNDGSAEAQGRWPKTRDKVGLKGMAPWDSVYFVRLAKCGYEDDQIFAFFPLLPWLMRYGKVLVVSVVQVLQRSVLFGWIDLTDYNDYSIYIGVGLTVNLLAFCVAAIGLHRLSLKTVKDKKVSALAVVLFCLNPASVFYSAVYTESLFAMFTWWALLSLKLHSESRKPFTLFSNYWVSVGMFAMASAVRSNGTLAVWFLLYHLIRESVESTQTWVQLMKKIYKGWQTFCKDGSGADVPDWCHWNIPSVYTYVQATYWDVGFLNFYEKIKRLPWVVQSIPVVALSFLACWTWACHDWIRVFTLSLCPDGSQRLVEKARRARCRLHHSCCLVEPSVAPYVYHLALMTAVAVLVMHVNVATRFLSSSPLLYWYMAQFMLNGSFWRSYVVWGWSLLYACLGSVLFINFYPWT